MARKPRWLDFFNSDSPRRSIPARTRRGLHLEQLETRRLLAAISLTNQEQLLLELANRARQNPGAEAARYGIGLNQNVPPEFTISNTPKQPLAPNQLLINSARLHSQDMLDRDYHSHVNGAGKGYVQRIADAGYMIQTAGGIPLVNEIIAWGGSTGSINQTQHVFERHAWWMRSRDHRIILLTNYYDEVGNGVRYGVFTTGGFNYNASMATQDFATSNNKVFITGVAYTDQLTRDNFYTVGEGIAGLTVRATKTDASYETQTGPSGGYSLDVSPGTYTVTFSGGPLAQPVSFPNIVVQDQNRKVDLIPSQAVTLQLTLAASSISENGGTTTATVSRTGLNTSSLTVNISSSDTTEATVPATINIPVGSGSVQFTVRAVNDTLFDGDQTVTISVSATNATSGSATLRVTDDERATLSLTLANNAPSESAGTISGTITRNGPVSSSLVVNLTSSDTSEATVPSTVTIPTGASSANFNVTIVNDTIPDGTQPVTITATAVGLTSTTANLAVQDDDILIANADSAITLRGRAVEISILANDLHPSSSPSDIIASIFAHPTTSVGTAQLVGNLLRFTPANGFTGIANLSYIIRDPRIGSSQPALVLIGVAATAKHNPLMPLDVSGNERINAEDALLIINLLNNPTASRIVDEQSNPLKPPYFDVNADGRINSLDALQVINLLNSRSSGEGEADDKNRDPSILGSKVSQQQAHWAMDLAFEQIWNWIEDHRSRRQRN